jgi:hypothetical protein
MFNTRGRSTWIRHLRKSFLILHLRFGNAEMFVGRFPGCLDEPSFRKQRCDVLFLMVGRVGAWQCCCVFVSDLDEISTTSRIAEVCQLF